jgi:hypothetical protein
MRSSKNIFGSNERTTTAPPAASVVRSQTCKPRIRINRDKVSSYDSTLPFSSISKVLLDVWATEELASLTNIRVPMNRKTAVAEWVELILRITAVRFCYRIFSSSTLHGKWLVQGNEDQS